MEPEDLNEDLSGVPQEPSEDDEKFYTPPPPTGTEGDSRKRLKEYIEAQAKGLGARSSPQYQKILNDAQEGREKTMGNNALGNLLMNSAAMFGNVGGKTPDTSAMNNYTKDINAQIQASGQNALAQQQRMDQSAQRQQQLYQYLAQMQRQDSLDDVARMRAKALADKAARNNWQNLHAKDAQGYPLERDAMTGDVRRIPNAAPEREKTEWKESDRPGMDNAQMLFDPKTGRYQPALDVTGKPVLSKVNNKEKQKVPASEAVNLGGYNSIDSTLDDLDKAYTDLAGSKGDLARAGSYAASFLPGNTADATKFNQMARRAAQSIGTVLEKGKLTDADFDSKYLPMMPKWGDSPEVVRSKIEGLKQYARTKQKADLDALTQAGYQTEDFTSLPPLQQGVVNAKSGSGTATAAPAFKPLNQMTREEKLRELEQLGGQ